MANLENGQMHWWARVEGHKEAANIYHLNKILKSRS